MTHPSIEIAIEYLEARGTKIPVEIILQLRQFGYPATVEGKKMVADLLKKEMKQAGTYQGVRQEVWAAVYDAVYNYLSSTEYRPTEFMPMATAVSKAYIETSEIAYEDGGGTLPLDEDTLAYAKGELDAQLGYIDSLFQTLKGLRKEGDFDAINEAFKRADGYSNSLDMFYNSIKTMAAGNKMLTFSGTDGRESCDDCKRYKNQRHRASWWVSHNAVPPSRDFACGGYHCDHVLVDDDGQEFTI
jgi:hypothetical protein